MKNTSPSIVPLSFILEQTPSRLDGVSEEEELNLTLYGCQLIHNAGLLLKLPQTTISYAHIIFHRFYLKRSMKEFCVNYVALSSLFLSCKIQETHKNLSEFLQVFIDLIYPDIYYINPSIIELFKSHFIRTERYILLELGFIFYNIELPHQFILFFLHILEIEDDNFIQLCWNYCNDALYSPVLSLTIKPHVIACAAVYLTSKKLNLKLPENPPWWLLFDTNLDELNYFEKYLNLLYNRNEKPKYVNILFENSHSLVGINEIEKEIEKNKKLKEEDENREKRRNYYDNTNKNYKSNYNDHNDNRNKRKYSGGSSSHYNNYNNRKHYK
ncbi:hypothetical protein ABK040_012973 [Willaertia magna]